MNRKQIRYYFDKYTYNVGLRGIKSLYDCYAKPSVFKQAIWYEYAHKKCVSVITYNVNLFTVGYLSEENGVLFFNVVTKSGSGKLALGPNEKIELKRQGIKWQQ